MRRRTLPPRGRADARRPALPRSAVALGDGFSLPTRWRTFSRWQRALPGRSEYPLLLEQARQQAARRPPNPHRMLLVIVPRIDAEADHADGERRRAVSQMTPTEVQYCRRCFAGFTELVFACTGGALRVEATELVVAEPARRLSEVSPRRYWLSAADAFAGRESLIPRDTFDSIAVFYKMPGGLVPGLHGGAIGRDHGLRGSAYFTIWVTDWAETVGPFNRTVIASLHEWLHNVSFYAHRVMGETAIPDCHAGEEYGYWDTDGGYPQWQAWNRDLMLHYIPRAFWYRLTSRGRLRPSDPTGRLSSLAPFFRSLAESLPLSGRTRFFRWSEVADDWMRRLPRLRERDLREVTGLGDLRVTVLQQEPNFPVVWALQTKTAVSSPYAAGDPVHVSPALDNLLSLGRLPSPGRVDNPVRTYTEAPLEGMAWLRSPKARPDRRDLLLLRVDLAPWLLARLQVVGRPARDSVLGYVSRPDPSEGQRVNVLVAAVDFGTDHPRDELDACGL